MGKRHQKYITGPHRRKTLDTKNTNRRQYLLDVDRKKTLDTKNR
jgi:hypothetical protein